MVYGVTHAYLLCIDKIISFVYSIRGTTTARTSSMGLPRIYCRNSSEQVSTNIRNM